MSRRCSMMPLKKSNFSDLSYAIWISAVVVRHSSHSRRERSQLIAQLELLPEHLFSLKLTVAQRELCRRRRVLLFVDNNAAAKSSSRSLTLLILLSELHRLWARSMLGLSCPSQTLGTPSRQLPSGQNHWRRTSPI